MDIQLESNDAHTIQSYDQNSLTVQNKVYVQSLIITKTRIHTPWSINKLADLTQAELEPLLTDHPEIIIIGHHGAHPFPVQLASHLTKQRIGLECMSIGAACRTFNILLSERRAVVVGFILETTG